MREIDEVRALENCSLKIVTLNELQKGDHIVVEPNKKPLFVLKKRTFIVTETYADANQYVSFLREIKSDVN